MQTDTTTSSAIADEVMRLTFRAVVAACDAVQNDADAERRLIEADLQRARNIVDAAYEQVSDLGVHRHEFSELGYCSGCGAAE